MIKIMLLSIDWDYFSGCVEHVFDAPIWGTKDTDYDRIEAWEVRALKRNGDLSKDFPLFDDGLELLKLEGIKTYATLSHSDAYEFIKQLKISSVLNLDSHHDLFSLSGNPKNLRPGNWAGLALEHGLIQTYTCVYPVWHQEVRVAEGYDLERTRSEIGTRFDSYALKLERKSLSELELKEIDSILLVQSPAWTNPEHDQRFFEICEALKAEYLQRPLRRGSKREKRQEAM
jgi:hypothetical protein